MASSDIIRGGAAGNSAESRRQFWKDLNTAEGQKDKAKQSIYDFVGQWGETPVIPMNNSFAPVTEEQYAELNLDEAA